MASEHKIRQLETALAGWLSHPTADVKSVKLTVFDFHAVYFYAQEPRVVQSNTVSILKRGIPQLLVKLWHHPFTPPELLIPVESMISSVTEGILVGKNLVKIHGTCGDGPTNLQIASFYHELYSQANMSGNRSPLLRSANAHISHQFLELFEWDPTLCHEIFQFHSELIAYEFFVCHMEHFYMNIAKCYKMAHSLPLIYLMVEAKDVLVSEKLSWSIQDQRLCDQNWKVQFMEMIFAPDFDNMDLEFGLFYKYLSSFDQWVPLLKTSREFLYSIHNDAGKRAILHAVESRMMLKSRSHTCTDAECLVILNFMNEIFDTRHYFLITHFFYSFQPSQYHEVKSLINNFEKQVCRVMGSSKWFLESVRQVTGSFHSLEERDSHAKVEYSCQKSFSRFLCNKLKTFFSNSLLVNKQILYYIQQLVKFDFQHSKCYPSDILISVTRLLESINLPAYKVLVSPKFQSIEFILQDSGVCEFKKEGAMRNIRLFENIVGNLYSVVQLKIDRNS